MKILSVSTATNNLSVALNENQQVLIEKNEEDKRNHSEHLDPNIEQILNQQQLGLKDIDRFAVAIGPGSYTGLRIGITTIKMFASILNKEVVGISTLQALAKSVDTSGLIVAGIDARNNNYFAGAYRLDKDGIPQSVIADGHYHIGLLLEKIRDYLANNQVNEIIFVGSGWDKHDQQYQDLNAKYQYGNQEQNIVHAGLIGQLAQTAPTVDPDQLLPRYLRRTQAEVDWHKKTGKPFGPDSDYVEEV